jgi:hypothetical protein
MLAASDDLVRRQPVWEALSELFLDTELMPYTSKYIAKTLIESGYSPTEISEILWSEVFPVVECNLRHPAGVCWGFKLDWLQEAILGTGQRQTAEQQSSTAQFIRQEWSKVCVYLPADFC